jgi:hypothetical protein
VSEPLLTRDEAIEVINRELGIPVKKRRLDRAAISGTGPTPSVKYGHSFLYEKDEVLAWGRTLLSPIAA